MTRRFVLLLAPLAAACSEPIGPSQDGETVSLEWVTGPAAAALDADHRFMFAPFAPASDELSRDQAAAVAAAYYKTVANSVGNLKGVLENQHGGSIDFTALTPCGRIIPISAPFQSVQVDPDYQFLRNEVAPVYQIELCQSDGSRTVGVDVSVATTVTIASDGMIRNPDPPVIGGSDFFPFGVPLRFDAPLRDGESYGLWALSPEAAVRTVYTMLHTRIRSVPQVTGCLEYVNPCAGHTARLWRLETAEPVPIRRRGATEDELAQVFFVQVGLGVNRPGGVYVAAAIQPAPAYSYFDVPQGQQTVSDSVLLALSEPLVMDSFTIASAASH